jgi:hypothetical protein
MERVRQKMEEVIQKQKALQGRYQHKTESSQAKDKSQYMIALGGVAAGITIAVIILLAKSIVMRDHNNLLAADRHDAVHTGEISKPSDEIAVLNERVQSLTESVSNLEARLTHVMALTDSLTTVEAKHAASLPQQLPESADTNPTSEMNEPDAARANQTANEAEKAFVPSHIVKSRVNLRPSASLHTTPISVLDVGTEVEYIGRSDGWYYVNTRSHGKGWCSSSHLSPLLSTQRKSSAK